MKKVILFIIVMLFLNAAQAQKKLHPVSESALTGMALPAGSQQDSRFLSEVSGKTLLELESKKANVPVKNVEILSLPPAALSGFTADSLVDKLSSLGWDIIPVEGDNKYAWLQKDNRFMIIYFSMGRKTTELYVGAVDGTPAIAMNTSTDNNIKPEVTQITDAPQTGQEQ